MVTTKPIKVDEEVKGILDKKKMYKRETYNDVLKRILKLNGKGEKAQEEK